MYMSFPSGNGMFDAMISKSCAQFLSDIDEKPGAVQRGGIITSKNNHIVHFRTEAERRKFYHCSIRRTPVKEATLRRNSGSPRACLMAKYDWLHYKEYQNGKSRLVLLKRTAPEAALAGIASRKFRLLDVVDMSHLKPIWLVRSNPLLISAKNVQKNIEDYSRSNYYPEKVKVSAIEFTMIDDWSRENWYYWDPKTGYVSSMNDPDPRENRDSEK